VDPEKSVHQEGVHNQQEVLHPAGVDNPVGLGSRRVAVAGPGQDLAGERSSGEADLKLELLGELGKLAAAAG
jgi:hypothetical protein